MLYSEKLDLAFIHLPKTGGVSFRAFLEENFPDMKDLPELPDTHHTMTELFDVLRQRGQDPDDTTILTIIRHPFAQVASQYAYWRSDLLSDEDAALPKVRAARELPFEEFVNAWVREDLYARHLLVNGELPNNVHLIRLDHIREDTERIFTKVFGLHLEVSLPHLNRSPDYSLAELYTPDIEARVRNAYKWYFQANPDERTALSLGCAHHKAFAGAGPVPGQFSR